MTRQAPIRCTCCVALALCAVAALSARASAQAAELSIDVEGAMAPVTARIALTCPESDAKPMTYRVGFGEGRDFEVERDSSLSIVRMLRATTLVRGQCRDARGEMYPARSRTVFAVDAGLERDSIIALGNAERTRRGLAALEHDAALDTVAEAHARDMAERGYFSHVTPEGQDLAGRFRAARLSYRAAAENIAGNASARDAIEAWLHSPGHRENLLNPVYERIGVGVYRTPSSPWTYYVQVFAK